MMVPGEPGFRHEWLKQVWLSDCPRGGKNLTVGLWSFADSNGYCYPNIDDIQRRVGLKSDSRISEHLKVLADHGWLRIGSGTGRNGWTSNNYHLLIPADAGTNSPQVLNISGALAPEILDRELES